MELRVLKGTLIKTLLTQYRLCEFLGITSFRTVYNGI